MLDFTRFFGGTSNYYRHPFNERFYHTDGVQYIAEECGAHWLIDAIASYQGADLDKDAKGFQVWSLTQDDGTDPVSAYLQCWSDTPFTSKLLVSQEIEFTDFPFEKLPEPLRIWVEGNGEDAWVALIPEEH